MDSLFANAHKVLGRDILELRRVYSDVSDAELQELISLLFINRAAMRHWLVSISESVKKKIRFITSTPTRSARRLR
jgi:hypothetical protein